MRTSTNMGARESMENSQITTKQMGKTYPSTRCLRSFFLPMCVCPYGPPEETLWSWVAVATRLPSRCCGSKRTFWKLFLIWRSHGAFLHFLEAERRAENNHLRVLELGWHVVIESTPVTKSAHPLPTTFFSCGLFFPSSTSSPTFCPANPAGSLGSDGMWPAVSSS